MRRINVMSFGMKRLYFTLSPLLNKRIYVFLPLNIRVGKYRAKSALNEIKTAGDDECGRASSVSGRQLIRSLRTVPRKGQVAMMLTGLLHALWPVLPPSAQISIVYNLPGVVGVSVMRRALS